MVRLASVQKSSVGDGVHIFYYNRCPFCKSRELGLHNCKRSDALLVSLIKEFGEEDKDVRKSARPPKE